MSTRTNKPRLPKTGQTTSVHDFDDGYFEKGSEISPRFVDNGDGTISDRVTNLMWAKSITKMIPGATGVTTDNLIASNEGAWANATSYVKGDFVHDSESGNYSNWTMWICAVDHTSTSAAPEGNWTANTAYSVDDIVKSSLESPPTYWECDTANTSLASSGAFAQNTAYSVGDVVVGSDGKYYYCTSAHTTFTQVGTVQYFYAGTAYVGDVVYDDLAGQGYGLCTIEHTPYFVPNVYQTYYYYSTYELTTPDYVHAYECNNAYYDSGEGFGYWSYNWNSWGHVGFEFDETYSQSDCWDVYATDIAVDNEVNGTSWSTGYTTLFELDRAERSGNWISATDNYSFSSDRTANSTYWRQTTWLGFTNPPILTYPRYEYWPESLHKADALEFAGYDDWRVPNLVEMLSIMNCQETDGYYSAFEEAYSTAKYQWTSTTARSYTYYSARIDMNTYGAPSVSWPQSQSSEGNGTGMFRPVRTIK